MNHPSPAVSALTVELSTAIRRDHRRRMRRRKALRSAGISVLAVAVLSSAALAAGGAFKEVETVTPVGEVELPQNVTIQAVDSFPEFVGTASPNGFITRTTDGRFGSFFYHVTGGEARELGCGGSETPTNNIYITSTRPLSEHEIRALLQPDGQLRSPKELERPPWIKMTSDGCPNPGVAGQPGKEGGTPKPDKAAVATPTSTTTRILVRNRTRVPLAGPAPSTTPTPLPSDTTTDPVPSSEPGTPSGTSGSR